MYCLRWTNFFPVDFVIVDYEFDREVLIILGRLFLLTDCALIDVHKRELTMQLNDQVTFNVVNALKFPSDVENSSVIESLGWDYSEEELLVELFNPEEFFQDENLEDFLEKVNIVSNARKFEPLNLQIKGHKKNKPQLKSYQN